jgi:DNA-binding CsgD family transcriptional regulator
MNVCVITIMRNTDCFDRATRYLHAGDPSVRRLSAREHDVARLIAAGVTDLVIAHRLGLSLGTVRNYVQRVQRRLQLQSRDEIAAWVIARIPPDDPQGRLQRIDDDGSH